MFNATKNAIEYADSYKENNAARKLLENSSIAWRIVLILIAILDLITSPVRSAIVCALEALVMLLVPVGKKKRFSQQMFSQILPAQCRANIWTNLDIITYGSFAFIRTKAANALNDYAESMIEYEKL